MEGVVKVKESDGMFSGEGRGMSRNSCMATRTGRNHKRIAGKEICEGTSRVAKYSPGARGRNEFVFHAWRKYMFDLDAGEKSQNYRNC